MNKPFHKILLVRTDRIGDVILTAPAISVLHKSFPEARISFLTRQYTAPLLSHYRNLNEIMIYNPEQEHAGIKGHLMLSRELRAKEFDAAFLFYPAPGLAMALFLAGIPFRVGIGYRWYSLFLNERIYEHRKHGLKHELEYNLSLLRNHVERLPGPDDIRFEFRDDPVLHKRRQSLLDKIAVNSNYIIVHPGSGNSAPNLPPEMFSRIIQYILDHTSFQVILAGTAQEESLINRIAHDSERDNIVEAPGLWDLEDYMSVISGSRFFISNSTGPLHIARSLDIPVMAFYCPAIPCSPRRWGPYNRPDSVLMPDVEPCKTCNIKKCPHGNCLSQISWDTIRTHLDRRLNELVL